MPYNALDPTTATAIVAPTLLAPYTNQGETLASMREELLLQLGGQGDIPPARLNKWINWAYLDLWTSLKLDEGRVGLSFDTIGGQGLYLLPYQFMSSLAVAVEDDKSIYGGRPLEQTDLRSYRMYEDKDGNPTHFFRYGNILVLYPTPKGAQTIFLEFRGRPLKLVNDTDSPRIPDEWHESIILNARKKGFSGLMEFDKALPAENEYINSIRRRQDTEGNEDENQIIRSAVPRNGQMLVRKAYRSAEPE